MALLVQDLGGQVVGSPADRLPPVPRRLQLGGEAEVADFQLHGLVDEEVT